MLVSRELNKLKEEFPELSIEKVDMLSQPLKMLKDGVRMIPTLKAGDNTLSGIYISSTQVRKFVTAVLKEE